MIKKIIIFALFFSFNTYALDEFLPQGEELNKLIELYGLDVDLPDIKEYPIFLGTVNQRNIPANHQVNDEPDILGDMVKTIQAAGEKVEDLVFYDYGKDKKEPIPVKKKDPTSDLTQLIDKKKISRNVGQAIKREQQIESPPIMPPGQMMDYLKSLETMGKGPNELKSNSYKKIYAYEGKMGKSLKGEIYNFEFVPSFDDRDSIVENGDGFIELEKNLNSAQGIIRGGIIKRDYVRTKVDLVMKQGRDTLRVPFLEIESLEQFLDQEKLRGLGGFILLNLENTIVSVDIDSSFEAKIYLDEKLNVVDEGQERFVFFVGVPVGNVLLKILNNKKEVAQKIIHVTENELYFDQIKLLPGGLERVDLFEKKLLGTIETELNIDGKDLNVFNTEYEGENIGLNTYEYYHPTMIRGTRRYFTLAHDGNEIFLGNLEEKKIEVPNAKFIDSVLDFLNIDSLYKQCIVQINLSMPVHDFIARGESEYDTLNIETYFLGSDGKFSEDINDLTEKAFIYGNFQGLVNGKVTYEDGSNDFFQSYCSDSTYLVEQY
ncbi:MAG: hypothetical protein DRQ88_02730 [Epsilonproteobacteria bacterium]|nr:MAG: hypothetical protein DRQ88_02730 [Campylobacterota bacterium]